jgi:hypothetical protein
MQVLEMDLAVFGFFAALGSSTSAYLAAKGVRDAEESLSILLRYVVLTKCIQFPCTLHEPRKQKWTSLAPIRWLLPCILFHQTAEVFPADLLVLVRKAKDMDWKNSKPEC